MTDPWNHPPLWHAINVHLPIVLGNGMIRLEVRPDITEIDPSLRDTVTGVPGFRQRTADTAVEMRAGQTGFGQ